MDLADGSTSESQRREEPVITVGIRSLFAAAVFAGMLAGMGGGAMTAEASGVPSVDALLNRLGFKEKDKAALRQGKVIGTDRKGSRDDQIKVAMAVKLKASVTDLAESVRKGLNVERDSATIAFGRLDPQGGAKQFAKASYGKADRHEVKSLINLAADGTFNLSRAEMTSIKKALKGVRATGADAAAKASAAYQAVLAGRFQAYVEKGLAGVADYEAGAKLEPAKELESAYEEAKPFLDEYFPDFGRALGQYPDGQSPTVTNDFYWIKRDVEGRPDFVLAHQMVQSGDDFLLMSQRQFFVGHTYESLQVVALVVPFENASAVFYVNSAYTDKITGLFSGIAESVGQKRTKEDLEKYFEAIKKGEG